MAQVINTNVMSLNSQRVLMNSQSSMATSLSACRPVCASTAPRTTRPVWRSPSASPRRSAASNRPTATPTTASRCCRPQKAHSTKSPTCCSVCVS